MINHTKDKLKKINRKSLHSKRKHHNKKQSKRRISLNRDLHNYDPNLPWWLQWLPVSSNNRSSWGNNSDGWTWGNNSNRGWGNDYDRNWGNDNRYDNRYDRPYRSNNYGNNYSNRDALFTVSFGSDD
jgi:hypothetical protein